jgi:hypothetical protein
VSEDGSDRNDEIWALAQAGTPHQAIADKYGISRQRVGAILADMTPATWGWTERDRAQIRAKESAVLERMACKLEDVIDHPPLQHSAIGKPIEDPRNPGTYLINEAVRVGAIRERRLHSESFRRLTGADLGTAGTIHPDDARRQAETFLAAAREQQSRERAELDQLRALAAAIPRPGDDDITDAEIIDP